MRVRPQPSSRAARNDRVLDARLFQPREADGLEQVVDRLALERSHRMLGMGGNEHDHLYVSAALGDREPVDARHVNVEEEDVGSVSPICASASGANGHLCSEVLRDRQRAESRPAM
jgi:hypothetical protein